MASGDRNAPKDENRKADPDRTEPAGISNAVVEGARAPDTSSARKAPDARTVDSEFADQVTGNDASTDRRTENDEAPLGGAAVAFPAPSAQPSQVDRPDDDPAKVKRAAVDVSGLEDEENSEWRRAGGQAKQ